VSGSLCCGSVSDSDENSLRVGDVGNQE
jgi:hypothetical protein